jgi:hypothetical protein
VIGRVVSAACISVAGLVACVDLTGPDLPAGAQRMDPPPYYAEWWRMTEQCSALGGDFERVRWYMVPRVNAFDDGLAGKYLTNGGIVVAEGHVMDGPVVRHEMLHAIRKRGGHPRGDFVNRCGGIVSCEGSCLREGEAPARDLSATFVLPADMEISASVWPASASARNPDGYLRLTVSVRNPSSRTVIVRLPDPDWDGPPASFGRQVSTRGYVSTRHELALAPEVTHFGPGETRQHVFDFFTQGTDWQAALPPGTVSFRGAYGERWSAFVAASVTP